MGKFEFEGEIRKNSEGRNPIKLFRAAWPFVIRHSSFVIRIFATALIFFGLDGMFPSSRRNRTRL